MCGIVGYTGGRVEGKLPQMAATIVHRGPDDEGLWESQTVHLGMRRLSILDIEGGKQPMFSDDGSVVLVFNGEIYNFVEIRQALEKEGVVFKTAGSDTEVLVQLYDKMGLNKMCERLVGMFAIAIYDKKKSKLFLVRDRFGKKPLYYRFDPTQKTIDFSSEFHTLRPDVDSEQINLDSLAWYFSQKAMPGGASIDQRIQQVFPATYLSFDLETRAAPETTCYYDWPRPPATLPAPDLNAALQKTEELLLDAVRVRMRADVEVGAFLSGGIDSSLVTCLAAKLSPKALRSYCLVYRDEIYNKSSDRRFAQDMAQRCGTEHVEVLLTPELLIEELPKIVRHYAQPNSVGVAAWFVAREMKKKIKVALSGDGSDEIFGSYFLHRAAAAMATLDAGAELPAALPNVEREFAEKYRASPLENIVDRFALFPGEELAKLLRDPALAAGVQKRLRQRCTELKSSGRVNRMLEFDCKNSLVEQILNYSDMLGMAHSLEIRAPFLDHRLVEYVFSLPAEWKMLKGQTKYLLKQIALRHLPEALVHRPKEGFVEPAVHWLSGPLQSFSEGIFAAQSFNALGFLNDDYVQSLHKEFQRSRDFFLGKRVWSLLMYGLWEADFVHGQ